MNPMTKMVDFDCVKCRKPLTIEENKTNKQVSLVRPARQK